MLLALPHAHRGRETVKHIISCRAKRSCGLNYPSRRAFLARCCRSAAHFMAGVRTNFRLHLNGLLRFQGHNLSSRIRMASSETRPGYLTLAIKQFNGAHTFLNGQCFGWAATSGKAGQGEGKGVTVTPQDADLEGRAFDHYTWEGVITQHKWAAHVSLQGDQTAGVVRWQLLDAVDPVSGLAVPLSPELQAEVQAWLADFLVVDVDMADLHAEWLRHDPAFADAARRFPGMRILRQDPWETLISFLCSSNNNIPRIRLMLNKIRQTYGTRLPQTGSHAFPSVSALRCVSEGDLRGLGLGYRAKFIAGTVAALSDAGWRVAALEAARAASLLPLPGTPPRGTKRRRVHFPPVPKPVQEPLTAEEESCVHSWLTALREQPHSVVQGVLSQLPGAGRKVADCIGLFAMDCPEAIPVDTHVWTMAVRDMDPSLAKCKSITPRVYERVGRLFRDRFGSHVGWAHTLLFAAELPAFKAAAASGEGVGESRQVPQGRGAGPPVPHGATLAGDHSALGEAGAPGPSHDGLAKRRRDDV